MSRTVFDLAGQGLAFEADDISLALPMSRPLRDLERAPDAEARIVCTLKWGEPTPPPAAPLLYEWPLSSSDATCSYYGAAGYYFLHVPKRVSAEIVHAERTLRAVVAAGCEMFLGGDVGMAMLDAAITMTGQTLVHGAALTLPSTPSAGFLLFAPSGAGKTTTALALAGSGFGLMSDDAGVIRAGPDCTHIWGLPRAPKVHRSTADLLPWLKPHLQGCWDREGEQPLAREALAGMAPRAGQPARLHAIVRLGGRVSGPTRICAADSTDILVALAADNMRHGPGATPHYQMTRFDALAHAVRETPVFELKVGDDIRGIAEPLSRALESSVL